MENANDILDKVNNEKTAKHLPVIVYVVTIILFGVLGNYLALSFYGFRAKRTATNILITLLSIADLAGCVVLVGDVFELCYSVEFRSAAGCKLLYFLKDCLLLTSFALLLLIAVDRYRRLCKPFQWQMSITTAKWSALAILVVFGLLSFRNFFLIDVVTGNITRENGDNLTGYFCRHSDNGELEGVILTFHILDGLSFISILFTTSGMYGCISVKLFKLRRRREKQTAFTKPEENTPTSLRMCPTRNTNADVIEESNTNISYEGKMDLSTSSGQINGISASILSVNRLPKGTENVICITQHDERKEQQIKDNKFIPDKKITLLMLSVFIASVVSFVPYFVLNLAIEGDGHLLNHDFDVGTELVLRSFMLQFVVNPFTTGAFNSKLTTSAQMFHLRLDLCSILFSYWSPVHILTSKT